MKKEQCLVLIKPDAVLKGLTGDIISDLAATGLGIVGAKVVEVTRELAEEHYQHLREEKFFSELIDYITGEFHTRTVVALVYEGEYACKKIRDAAGSTNPEEAHPGSIRGKYGRITSKGRFENVIHASESAKEGEREIKLWFRPGELVSAIFETETRSMTTKETFWKGG
ncbi:nucleoside-diphosphate kinase [Candidatus Woesearchaeota archaeon]|nr:nucleoside-diphosphate kinase [Candidatus Woesearchaeota archaeon]